MAGMPPSATGGALYLIFTQVASRALTFAGNQILLRYLSPSLLGIAVQLELVSVTVLYFARESLRVALQRQHSSAGSTSKKSKTHDDSSQGAVNLSYLAVAVGLLLACLSGVSYLRAADLEVHRSPMFLNSFALYGFATLIELLAEPFFVVIQQHSLYKARAGAETTAAIARCLFACSTAFIASRKQLQPSVLPFAVGQLAYAVILFLLYLQAARGAALQKHFSLLPNTLVASEAAPNPILNLFDRTILSLATTMYLQSIFKLLLTQGDALILSVLSSLADQGAFALASNYGGLLARLVFQPIEESSRNIFGRLLSSTTSPKSNQQSTIATQTHQALRHLSNTLHFYLLLALPLCTIAPYLLPLVVRHLIGARWYTPSTTALLSSYCFYIPFTAVNGILDAFVTSVATPAQLRAQSGWMALFTGIYGMAAWGMLSRLRWGAAGLVAANILNMAMRIAWGGLFVRRWTLENGEKLENGRKSVKGLWMESMPAPSSIVVAMGVVVGLRLGLRQRSDGHAEGGGRIDLEELSFVIAGGGILGITILLAERDFLISTLETVLPQRLTAKLLPFKSKAAPAKPGTYKKDL